MCPNHIDRNFPIGICTSGTDVTIGPNQPGTVGPSQAPVVEDRFKTGSKHTITGPCAWTPCSRAESYKHLCFGCTPTHCNADAPLSEGSDAVKKLRADWDL